MTKGIVKWFDARKGYGFIQIEEGKDIFVHHTEINEDGFKSLDEGQQVEFEIRHNEKGDYAANVIKL